MINKYNQQLEPGTMAYIRHQQDLQKYVDRYYEQKKKQTERIEEERIMKDLEKELYKKLDRVLEDLFTK